MKNDWRSESVPRNISSPKTFSAATEKRAGSKEAQEAQNYTAPSAKVERERQHLISIVDFSVPSIYSVFAKNTAAEQTVAAKEIRAPKKRECTGRGKYLARRIAETNNKEIDEWYEYQDEECEEELDQNVNKCQF